MKASRSVAVDCIKRLMWKPYKYGGDDPMDGLDCSGLVVEYLKILGKFTEKQDASAAGLWEMFKDCQVSVPHPGDLVFYFNEKGHCVHVGIAIDGGFVLEARGGTSETKTLEDAIKQNAYIAPRKLSDTRFAGGWKAVSLF